MSTNFVLIFYRKDYGMIIESINALTKKLTGQDGTGSDITESINDLTKKWTGSNDRGETSAEALDVLAQHAEGGGGGGGDLSTCTVTVKNGHNENSGCAGFPLLYDSNEYNMHGICISTKQDISPYTVPLYKGKAYFVPTDPFFSFLDMEGDIVHDDTLYCYVITGNCTVMVQGQN